MKLKTLKDLRESVFKAKDEENILFINNFTSKKQPHLFDRFPAGHLIEYKESIVFYNDLKQEAIKWIKELQKLPEPTNSIIQGTINWIKHFFNITEEDLK